MPYSVSGLFALRQNRHLSNTSRESATIW